MSNKQIVKDLLDHLPEEASLLDIARELEFVAGIREGIEQADRGECISVDEVRAQLQQWAHTK